MLPLTKQEAADILRYWAGYQTYRKSNNGLAMAYRKDLDDCIGRALRRMMVAEAKRVEKENELEHTEEDSQ